MSFIQKLDEFTDKVIRLFDTFQAILVPALILLAFDLTVFQSIVVYITYRQLVKE